MHTRRGRAPPLVKRGGLQKTGKREPKTGRKDKLVQQAELAADILKRERAVHRAGGTPADLVQDSEQQNDQEKVVSQHPLQGDQPCDTPISSEAQQAFFADAMKDPDHHQKAVSGVDVDRAEVKEEPKLETPNPETPNRTASEQPRRQYLESSAMRGALLTSEDTEVSLTGKELKHGFMSTMTELMPGLSQHQKQRMSEQKDQLKLELEKQVQEKKAREAKAKAEEKAREEREEAEIQAYYKKLQEREKMDRLRRHNPTQSSEPFAQTPVPVARNEGTQRDRDERVAGLAGTLPVKKENVGPFSSIVEQAPEVSCCSPTPVHSRQQTLPSERASFDGGSGSLSAMAKVPVSSLSSPKYLEQVAARNAQIDQLGSLLHKMQEEQARIREEFSWLTDKMDKQQQAPKQAQDPIALAQKTIQETERYLAKGQDSLDQFVVNTHLVPKSINVIPEALPSPRDTKLCAWEGGAPQIDQGNHHNENQVQRLKELNQLSSRRASSRGAEEVAHLSCGGSGNSSDLCSEGLRKKGASDRNRGDSQEGGTKGGRQGPSKRTWRI